MNAPFSVLLDAPGHPASRIQIAKLGDTFNHGKYGQFAITKDDVDSWRKNLAQLPGGRALIDTDHQADRAPRNTEASGWITGVTLEDGVPMAEVEWTPKGQREIEEKRYLFISPTFGPFKDETGSVHDNTLMGAALTNKPFLNMPAITLASDERVSLALDQDPAARFYQHALDGELGDNARALVLLDVTQHDRDQAKHDGHALPDGSYPINNAAQLHAAAVLAGSHHGDWQAAQKLIRQRAGDLGVDVKTLPGFASDRQLDTDPAPASDSRAPMSQTLDTGEILKTLGLDENADQTKVLDAISTLQARPEKAEPAAEPKTLEQQATDAGKIILDAGEWETAKQQAAAGAAIAKQLEKERFDNAFEKAVTARKATPAEEDRFRKFYELDADETLKMLDEREPIRPVDPSGKPSLELDADGNADPRQLAANGIHPDSHQLDRKIRKFMLDNQIPESGYANVMAKVAAGEVTL